MPNGPRILSLTAPASILRRRWPGLLPPRLGAGGDYHEALTLHQGLPRLGVMMAERTGVPAPISSSFPIPSSPPTPALTPMGPIDCWEWRAPGRCLTVRLAGDIVHQVPELALAGTFNSSTGLADLADHGTSSPSSAANPSVGRVSSIRLAMPRSRCDNSRNSLRVATAQPDQHLHGILIQVADHGNAAYRTPGECR